MEGECAARQGQGRHVQLCEFNLLLQLLLLLLLLLTMLLVAKDNAINGVPTCGDARLNKILRETWGYDGYITSDTDAVGDIWSSHKYVKTAAEASCLAISQVRLISRSPFQCRLADPKALRIGWL